jgi:hypothetical protein
MSTVTLDTRACPLSELIEQLGREKVALVTSIMITLPLKEGRNNTEVSVFRALKRVRVLNYKKSFNEKGEGVRRSVRAYFRNNDLEVTFGPMT